MVATSAQTQQMTAAGQYLEETAHAISRIMNQAVNVADGTVAGYQSSGATYFRNTVIPQWHDDGIKILNALADMGQNLGVTSSNYQAAINTDHQNASQLMGQLAGGQAH
jgi:hypothetical protein